MEEPSLGRAISSCGNSWDTHIVTYPGTDGEVVVERGVGAGWHVELVQRTAEFACTTAERMARAYAADVVHEHTTLPTNNYFTQYLQYLITNNHIH